MRNQSQKYLKLFTFVRGFHRGVNLLHTIFVAEICGFQIFADVSKNSCLLKSFLKGDECGLFKNWKYIPSLVHKPKIGQYKIFSGSNSHCLDYLTIISWWNSFGDIISKSAFDIMKLAYGDLYVTEDIVTFMIPANSSMLLSLPFYRC